MATPPASGHAGRGPLRRTGAAVGVLAAAADLAVAELAALAVAPSAGPFLAVGALVVDLSPGWLKDTIIALFGTADKAVLLVLLGVATAALAAAAGLIEARHPWRGVPVLAAMAGLGLLATGTRTGFQPLWLVPGLLGLAAGVWTLRAGSTRNRAWHEAPGRDDHAPGPRPARRSFLTWAAAVGAASALGLVVARTLDTGRAAVIEARRRLVLPRASRRAPATPAGAELRIPGLTPLVTPNAEFYRIDTALSVPRLSAEEWRLRVTGLVEREVEIGWAELVSLPLEEHMITLGCVSNEVGGNLVGTALWLGLPVRRLLDRARPRPGADMVLSRSTDGWTAGTPLDVLRDPGRAALLAVGMNGRPLPFEHGFPARLVVPGLFGYVSATKWVVELEVTRFADATAYWTDRGWSARGPVKLTSRIDTPSDGRTLTAGRAAVAGVAWCQHTGISAVEVRVDDGAWRPATLAAAVSADTWRQWHMAWDARPGRHALAVRAVDAEGNVQTGRSAPPVPDGATGWHTVTVEVR